VECVARGVLGDGEWASLSPLDGVLDTARRGTQDERGRLMGQLFDLVRRLGLNQPQTWIDPTFMGPQQPPVDPTFMGPQQPVATDPYADPARLAREAVFGGLPASVAQQLPRFAQALEQQQRASFRLNLTGPNILPPDDAAPSPEPSVFDQTGALLAKGDLPQRLRALYTEHGPEAFMEGVKTLHTAVQTAAPQGRVPWRAVAPGLNQTLAGAMTTVGPVALPAIAAHPVGALVGAVAGMALSGGVEAAATRLGLDPETTTFLGQLAGFLPPEHLATAAMPFAPYTRRMLKETLEATAGARVKQLLQDTPALAPLVKWLHPSETVALATMSPAAQEDFLRIHQELPSTDLLGALGRAGMEKRGWYAHSRAAIQHVYGEDADLFAGILAATSPQNSVEMNLQNAVQIYRGWTQAGRPTDRDTILRIMGENVLGGKGEASVLEAWQNNTVTVLQGGQVISGPKVDSFWRNLRNRAVQTPSGAMRPEDALTLDAWMSNVLGVQQTNFAGTSQTAARVEARNPGYSSGYLAATAKLREAATRHDMTPEELQETIWSWGKALYEQANATGESAVSIIQRGGLDHSAVAGTPDFSTLFQQPAYREAILASGPTHATQLATLQPAAFPTLQPPSARDQQWQLKAAAVLDRLRENRQIASDLRVGQTAPGTVNVNVLQEGMPGSTTRVAPELATPAFTQAQRDRVARSLLAPNTDVRGENVLLKAMGLPTTETTIGLGQWTPPGGGPTQYNTLDAAGVQARLTGTALHPADARRIVTAARLQGLFDAQDAVATVGVVYDQAHKDVLHVFTPTKVKGEVFEGLAKLLPPDYALVNKGGGTPGHVIDILRLDGQPVTSTEEELVRGYLASYAKAGARPAAITPGTNVAGSYLLLPWGSGAGSQQVTTAALEHYDALPKTVRAALDGPAVRRLAAAKLQVWQTEGAKRGLTVPEDYRRMLQIVADGGVSALRRAVENPAQLVPSLVLLGLGRLGGESPRRPTDPSP
jgi:hypothetical protein